MDTNLLEYTVICSPLRDFFIKRVNLPLMKVLLLIGKRIPEVTKENTRYEGTHVLIDIFDRVMGYTDVRRTMLKSAFKVFLMKIEIDNFYRDAFLLFIEETIKEILAGNFPARRDEAPNHFWNNKTPKGGKYSIISILQDKKAMENLLGDGWKLKEKDNGITN